jgi:hypothetical protein
VLTLGGADGLQAEVLTYGGILRRLTLPTRGGRTDLNETAFPCAILRPGLLYSRWVAYTFSHQ